MINRILAVIALGVMTAGLSACVSVDKAVESGTGVATTLNNFVAGAPILGDLYKGARIHATIDKALGNEGYMTMPDGWTTFTVDAKTAAVYNVKTNSLQRDETHLDNKIKKQTVGLTKLTYGVGDDIVAIEINPTSGPGMAYDSQTSIIQLPSGTYRLVKEDIKGMLNAMAQHPAEFKQYAEGKKCSDEDVVRGFLNGSGPQKSVLGEGTAVCEDLSNEINKMTATLWEGIQKTSSHMNKNANGYDRQHDRNLFQIIDNEKTESGAAVGMIIEAMDVKAGRKPVIKYYKFEDILAQLRKYRDPALQAAIATINKDMPAEREIVPHIVVTKNQEVATGRTVANPGTSATMLQGRNIEVMRKERYQATEFEWTAKAFRGPQAATWAGWLMFTNDALVNSLKHFDYSLQNKTIQHVKTVNPLKIYDGVFAKNIPMMSQGQSVVWHLQDGDSADNERIRNNDEEVARMKRLTGRGLDIPGAEEFTTPVARENWHRFVQSLTPDQLRKLVVTATDGKYRTEPISGPRLNMYWESNGNGKRLHSDLSAGVNETANIKSGLTPGLGAWVLTTELLKINFSYGTRETEIDKSIEEAFRRMSAQEAEKGIEFPPAQIPHNMGLLAVSALAPEDPRAINVPIYWDAKGPGLTLKRYLFLATANKSAAALDRSAGLEVARMAVSGNIEGAIAKLNIIVPDQKLVELKKLAIEREIPAREAFLAAEKVMRVKMANDIRRNPTAQYAVFLDILQPNRAKAGPGATFSASVPVPATADVEM